MKIKNKITSSFLTTFAVVSVVLTIVVGVFVAIAMTGQAVKMLEIDSSERAERLRTYLNGQKQMINILGSSTVFRDFLQVRESTQSIAYTTQKQRTTLRLDRTIKSDDTINELFLIDKTGKVVASTNRNHEGTDKTNDSFFTGGLNGTFIKEIYYSDVVNELAWGLATPLIDDANGNILGVVVARMELEPFFDILETSSDTGSDMGKTGESFLINKSKYFITPSLFLGEKAILNKQVLTQNAADCFNLQEIGALKSLDYDYSSYYQQPEALGKPKLYRDYRNVPIFGTHAYIPEIDSCLITKIDQTEIFAPIIKVILISLAGSILGVFIFYFVGSFLAKKITKPIETLEEGLRIIQKGNLDYKVGTNSQDEVGELSREFDRLTEAIKQSRLDIDKKVEDQTKEIIEKGKDLEDRQKAVLNILDDVEEEKNKVSAERDKVNAILQSIGDGVFVVDDNLRIVLINKIALALSGVSLKDAVGKKYTEVLNFVFEATKNNVPPEDFILKAMSTGVVQEMPRNTMLVKRDNAKIAVADSAAPLKDLHGRPMGCVVVFRDVTKEREIDRMKTEFISLASHQLRTPLSAMKWFSEMLINGDAGTLNKEQMDFVQNISQSNERMIGLVNSLLNISRIDSGRLVIDPKPTDLGELVQQVLTEIKNKTEEKKQQVVVSVHSELPKINIDPKMIGEVYKNLLTNANKYTPENGEISIIISEKEGEIISQVSDNGMGIPDKDQKHIFEKFFRADNTAKIETEGSGLGLYLAKSIVESSGGKIWFKSSEKQGTSFWFTLPLVGVKPKEGEVTLNG